MKNKIIRGVVIGVVLGALLIGTMRLGTIARVIWIPAYFVVKALLSGLKD